MRRTNTSSLLLLCLFPVLAWMIASCDERRLYETNHEFDQRYWVVSNVRTFEFDIPDTLTAYNLYCNVRSSLDYPYSRIFISYQVADSTGKEISKQLVGHFLFDQKTGKPNGESGLGDLYDHQFPLQNHFRFQHEGHYTVRLSQFMRVDTLLGILAVGIRVEKGDSEPPEGPKE